MSLASAPRKSVLCFTALVFFPAHLLFSAPAIATGTVSDALTGSPVAGARLILRNAATGEPLWYSKSTAEGAWKLDLASPGRYAIDAEAPGFAATDYRYSQQVITVLEDPATNSVIPTRFELTIRLPRPTVLSGRVLDGETRQPLAHVSVEAWRTRWRHGTRSFTTSPPVLTAADGSFRIESLAPGDYYLRFRPAPGEEDLPDYLPAFWPGPDPETVPPLAISQSSAGGEQSLPPIHLKPTQLAVISVRSTEPGCRSHYTLGVFEHHGSIYEPVIPPASVPCGEAKELRVPPGQYTVEISSPNHSAGMGLAEIFASAGSNRKIVVPWFPQVRFQGRVSCEECAEDWRDRLSTVRISIAPLSKGAAARLGGPEINDEGGFEMLGTFPGRARFEISGLPPSLALKQLHYNGAELPAAIVPARFGSLQSLAIGFTDRPATVSGRATLRDAPYPGAQIVLAPAHLPLDEHRYPLELRTTTAGNLGRFALAGIAAGKYRIAAIDPDLWAQSSDMPGSLAEWLSSAAEIAVEAGSTVTETLQLLQ